MSLQDRPTIFVEDMLDKNGYLVYTGVGVSMMPLLRQGKDLMVIRRKAPGRCGKYDVVLYKTGGRYILHRILKVRESDYVIAGDNCFHREYGITDRQILGVLTDVVRNGRHLSVTDKKYLFYVRLWCDFYPIRAAVLYGLFQLRRLKSKLAWAIHRILKNN